MKFTLLVALAACASASPTESTANPLEKVIAMLANIEQEQKDTLDTDKKTFSQYTNWCDDTITTNKNNNENANTEIERMTASQNEHEANANELAENIAENGMNIDRWTADKKAAQRVRAKERAAYMAAYKDLSESIAAMGAAMDTLREQTDKDEGSNKLDGGKTVYEAQSGGILEILEDLQTKFQEDLHAKDTEEREAVAAFDTLMQLLDTKLNEENQMMSDNKKDKGDNLDKAGYAKGEANRLTQEVADAQKYIEETEANCRSETTAFDQRVKVAEDELEAIATALDLLRNPDTTLGAATSGVFAQLRSHSQAPHEKAIAYLNQMSKKLGSSTLAAVAVSAKADVFGKVTKMIRELITRLQKEAAGDLTHHTKCLKDLSENEKTRNAKTVEVEEHSTEKSRLEGVIAKLTDDIATMTKEQADMQQEQQERTEIRSDENAENTRVIAESKAALPLVQKAVTTLKEFYDSVSLVQRPALIQSKAPVATTPMPKITPTAPAAAGSGGVVSLMEHVAEDLAATITDTETLEKKQSNDFQTWRKDNEEAMHKKQLSTEQATRSKQDREQDLTDTKGDLKGSQEQLATAIKDFEEAITPVCIKTQKDPAARIEKRKQEIASLEEAMKILKDE